MNERNDNFSAMISPLLFTPDQAARELAVCRRTLQNWTKDNRVPYVRLNGILRYPADDLREWIRANRSDLAPMSSPVADLDGPAA